MTKNSDLVKLFDVWCDEIAEKLIKKFTPNLLINYSYQKTLQFAYNPHKIIELLESWGYLKYQFINEHEIYFQKSDNTKNKLNNVDINNAFLILRV